MPTVRGVAHGSCSLALACKGFNTYMHDVTKHKHKQWPQWSAPSTADGAPVPTCWGPHARLHSALCCGQCATWHSRLHGRPSSTWTCGCPAICTITRANHCCCFQGIVHAGNPIKHHFHYRQAISPTRARYTVAAANALQQWHRWYQGTRASSTRGSSGSHSPAVLCLLAA